MKVEQTPLTDELISEIIAYLPYFLEDNKFGEWSGGDKVDDVIQMPYLEYSEKVIEFFRLLYSAKFLVDFDWGGWDEGRDIIGSPELIQQADLLTLRMLLTAVMRNDRFCRGAFLSTEEDVYSVIKYSLNTLTKEFVNEINSNVPTPKDQLLYFMLN